MSYHITQHAKNAIKRTSLEKMDFAQDVDLVNKMEKLTWKQFDTSCKLLADIIKLKHIFKNIYGIPRGGLVVAVRLSHLLNIPLTDTPSKEHTLIVDDICDSGKTLQRYKDYVTAVIYKEPKSITTPTYHIIKKREFVMFPWETQETAKIDYENL